MTFPLLAYIDLASNVLPLSAGLYAVRRMTGTLRLFYALLVVGTSVEVTSFVLGRLHVPNLWLIQIYHLVHFSVTMFVLSRWQSRGWMRVTTTVFLVGFAAFWLAAKWAFEPLHGDDQYTYTVACVILLLVSIDLLSDLARNGELVLPKDCRFWVTCGVLLYFATNVSLFSAFRQFTMLPGVDAFTVWYLHWAVNVIVNVVFTVGFLMLRR